MATKPLKRVKYLDEKRGIYAARKGIPADLRPFLDNRSEFFDVLGSDRRHAIDVLPGYVADYNRRLNEARAAKARIDGIAAAKIVRAHSPMTIDEIARSYYREMVAFDDELRDDPRYANIDFDEMLVQDLRRAVAGKADDEELDELVGPIIERYRARGNTTIERGTLEWRRLARALSVAKLEAMRRMAERDDGDFSGTTSVPMLQTDDAEIEPAPAIPVVTFTEIIDEEVRRRTSSKDAKGVVPQTIAQLRRAAESFAKHRKSDNALTATHDEGEAWVRHLQAEGKYSNGTIGTMLVDLRTVLNWGRNQQPAKFPAVNALKEIAKPKSAFVPPELRTFTMEEAQTVLTAALKEKNPTLRFVPWITAYSGARVGEAANLKREDFFQVGEDWFFRITPTQGRRVKTQASNRRVPVHPDLVANGLIKHIQTVPEGERLFIPSARSRIGEWMREKVGLRREYMAPNHSWRHLFEDLCTVGGVIDDARSYITGRSTKSSRDRYGRSDVALPGLAREMEKVPSILAVAKAPESA